MTAPDARSLLAALVEALPQWSPHPDIKDRVSGPLVSIPDVRGAIARALAAPATLDGQAFGRILGQVMKEHRGVDARLVNSILRTVTAALAAAPATLPAIDPGLREAASHLLAEAHNGPWWRETGVAGDEEEHMVWLTNEARDTLMLNADDVALLVNAAHAALAAPAAPVAPRYANEGDDPRYLPASPSTAPPATP